MAELFGIFLIERLQLTAEDAATLGDELVDLVHRHYSGQSLYFPKDRGYVRLEHDTYIWHHLRRGNASEIAAHLGVSYVYVYQRYRVMLAESRRRKPQLPGMDSRDRRCVAPAVHFRNRRSPLINENTMDTAMNPIQRIRTVLDAYKTPGSPLSKARLPSEIDSIVADVERIDRLTAVDDKLKVDILRASIVNIGRLLPDRMSIAFTRLDAVTMLKQVFPDGETRDCVFTGHADLCRSGRAGAAKPGRGSPTWIKTTSFARSGSAWHWRSPASRPRPLQRCVRRKR